MILARKCFAVTVLLLMCSSLFPMCDPSKRAISESFKCSWSRCSLMDISPYGKVPVLVVDEGHIHESAAINQYIDEKWGKSMLMGCVNHIRNSFTLNGLRS